MMDLAHRVIGPGIQRIVLRAALSLLGASLLAQDLSLDLGYGGFTVPGRWVPLRVSCPGAQGDEILRIEYRDPQGQALWRETYPLQGQTRLECPLSLGGERLALDLSLLRGEREVARRRLDPWEKTFPGHVIVCCGIGGAARTAISLCLYPYEPVLVSPLDANLLPSQALCYDSLSALVVNDPGPVLSHAQRDALLSWLAGGGRLLVFGRRAPGEDFLGGRAQGRVSWFSDTADSTANGARAEFWRSALGLKPYTEERRLGPREILARLGPMEPSPREAARPRLSSTAFACLWFLGLVFIPPLLSRAYRGFARGKAGKPTAGAGLRIGLAYALISIAPALAVGGWIGSGMNHGVSARGLAYILPGDGGILATMNARLPGSEGWLGSFGSSLPWSAPLRFRSLELGSLSQRPFHTWEHKSRLAYWAPSHAEPGKIGFQALLPAAAIDPGRLETLRSAPLPPYPAKIPTQEPRAGPPDDRVRLAFYDGPSGQWWGTASGTRDWRPLGEKPQWVFLDQACIQVLCQPGQGLLVGWGGRDGPKGLGNLDALFPVSGRFGQQELLWAMGVER